MSDDRKYKYLSAQVDVLDESKETPPTPAGQAPAPKPTKRVGPGLLSELDLTDEQVEKLPRNLVRSATADEIRAGDAAVTQKRAREIAQKAEADRRDAGIDENSERQQIIDDFERQKNDALAKLDAEHEKARADAAARTTEELNKAQADATAKTARPVRRAPVNTQGGDPGTTAGGGTPTANSPGSSASTPAPSAAPSTPPKP